jgi:hypothetical protein
MQTLPGRLFLHSSIIGRHRAKNSKGNKSGRIIGALCWGLDWLHQFMARGSLEVINDIISAAVMVRGVIFSFKAARPL